MNRAKSGKLALLLILVLAIAVFFAFNLGSYLTIDSLKERHADLAVLVVQRPLLMIGGFFLIYVAVTALSLPGAAIMTLAAGAIFGLGLGMLVVSFASVIGASLAMLSSRYLLRDWVKARFGRHLRAFDEGIRKDGAYYLLTLRLIPAFPFFLINLAMGLTAMPLAVFAAVSQIGMFPGTLVFVNAGTQLARIERPSDILSSALVGSFVLLGLFPLLAKFGVGWWNRRRIYKGWKRPRSFDRNLIVIGAGAGGLVSAYIAATVRAKVTLVEAAKMGGDCLNYGCVPSKALIRSARLAREMRTADHYGLSPVEPRLSFEAVMQRVQAVIKAIEPADSVARYTDLGVDVRLGHARIVDPWTVEIRSHDGDTKNLTTRSIVIAAGAVPVVPDIPGLGEAGYLTSDTMWEALAKRDSVPDRLVIIGGGPIGCEMAQAFHRLGAKVTLIEGGERLMLQEDDDVSAFVMDMLREERIDVLSGHQAMRCEVSNGQKQLIARAGDKEVLLPFDDIIVAVGRVARLSGYGLEEIGIDTAKVVVTNDYLQTIYPNIFAAGDVAGPYQFTHFAAHQAWFAAVNALFGDYWKFRANHSVIPWVTFLDPEVAHVGLTEATAKEQGVAYDIVRFNLDYLDRAIAEGAAKGFVKLLVAPGNDRILGVSICALHAGEMIAEYVLAMKHKLGLKKILGTIHCYPTMAEANKYAAGEWKKSNKPERLLRWIDRYHRWRRE